MARARREQAVGRKRAGDVGGLDRDLDVVEVLGLEQRDVRQGAFDESLGGRAAVLVEQMRLERPGVDADADGHAAGLGRCGDGADTLGAADVAGIDAQAVDAGLERLEREAPIEMDVRDERHALGLAADLGEGGGGLGIRNGEAHDVAARGHRLADAIHRGRNVARVGVRHRLDGDGRSAADGHAAELDAAGPLPGRRRRGWNCRCRRSGHGNVAPRKMTRESRRRVRIPTTRTRQPRPVRQPPPRRACRGRRRSGSGSRRPGTR